jgi:hypothetical protein
VAHDPDDEALDVPDAGDSGVVLLAFAVFVAEPAVAFVDVPEFFAPKAAAFAAAPDALAEPALPLWPAAPETMVGIPNPAGEIGFCFGVTVAGEERAAAWAWGTEAGCPDAGTLVPGAFDPSGSSVSSN